MSGEHLLSYKDLQNIEWTRAVTSFLLTINKLLADKVPIQFGPRYHIPTSRGEPLQLFTMLASESDKRTAFLFGFNQEQDLIGIRETNFLKPFGPIVHADGNIRVAKRQRGYAIPLELAHMDLLQRYADTYRYHVLYTVVNNNMAQLATFKKAIPETEAQNAATLLTAKEEEQRRWQKIYGKNGLLGFNKFGVRGFSPHNDPHRISIRTVGEIELKRDDMKVDSLGRVLPVVVYEHWPKNAARTKQERLHELKTVIIPAMEHFVL